MFAAGDRVEVDCSQGTAATAFGGRIGWQSAKVAGYTLQGQYRVVFDGCLQGYEWIASAPIIRPRGGVDFGALGRGRELLRNAGATDRDLAVLANYGWDLTEECPAIIGAQASGIFVYTTATRQIAMLGGPWLIAGSGPVRDYYREGGLIGVDVHARAPSHTQVFITGSYAITTAAVTCPCCENKRAQETGFTKCVTCGAWTCTRTCSVPLEPKDTETRIRRHMCTKCAPRARMAFTVMVPM